MLTRFACTDGIGCQPCGEGSPPGYSMHRQYECSVKRAVTSEGASLLGAR